MSSIRNLQLPSCSGQSRNPHQHCASEARRPWESSSSFVWLRFACAISSSGCSRMASAQVCPASEPVDPRGPLAQWVGKTLINAEASTSSQTISTCLLPRLRGSLSGSGSRAHGTPAQVPFAAHFRRELTLPADAHIASAYAKVSGRPGVSALGQWIPGFRAVPRSR